MRLYVQGTTMANWSKRKMSNIKQISLLPSSRFSTRSMFAKKMRRSDSTSLSITSEFNQKELNKGRCFDRVERKTSKGSLRKSKRVRITSILKSFRSKPTKKSSKTLNTSYKTETRLK
jgi:hypothetical protein